MATYTAGKTTAAVGTDILVTCPPNDVLVPILRGVCVITGAQAQTLYVCTPLGIAWTDKFMDSTDTSTKLSDCSPADNPDGTSHALAAADLVVLTTQYGAFHGTGISSLQGATDIDAAVTSSFAWDDNEATFSTSDFTMESGVHIGVHISAVAIAQGATISNAVIRIHSTSAGSGGESVDFTVYVEDDETGPAAPSTYADADNATKYQSSTENGKVFTGSAWHDFDISTGLQYLVNKIGWSSGNSLNVYILTDAITGSGTAAFDNASSSDPPKIVVNEASDTTFSDTPVEDVPYGSLAYCYYNPNHASHWQLRCPANKTTILDNLCIQGGVPTQKGKLAPASGRGVPMLLCLTNDTAQASIEWADFEWYDPASFADDGLMRAPTGKAARQYPVAAGSL